MKTNDNFGKQKEMVELVPQTSAVDKKRKNEKYAEQSTDETASTTNIR